MVRSGELSAPIVIGRDHLDCGSVASPNRETESMKDGTDAVADWPLLNAMVNIAGGATWVSFHHGGGVGMGLPTEFVENVITRIPMDRMAEPDDYQGALIFLLSDSSKYMNGSVLSIDGGRSIW